MWQECLVYECPSSSGGKVWIVPTQSSFNWTMSGKLSSYCNGLSLTHHALITYKPLYETIDAKERKGYSFREKVWVNTGSHEMRTHNPDQEPEPEPSNSGTGESKESAKVLPVIQVGGSSAFDF